MCRQSHAKTKAPHPAGTGSGPLANRDYGTRFAMTERTAEHAPATEDESGIDDEVRALRGENDSLRRVIRGMAAGLLTAVGYSDKHVAAAVDEDLGERIERIEAQSVEIDTKVSEILVRLGGEVAR